ncbi:MULTISPECIES: hypothetical protein [unclassified Lysobacter]|uniref:hypothetical protein n=1 Tax=unclassified Lysobacter TaxID=2635362 RepID=UPI001C24E9E9|nr:hypothetical protein [Lysobacter sp. MMG2]MBU8976465.1 hypothetical protein [Lysobacter sp. MMG2]
MNRLLPLTLSCLVATGLTGCMSIYKLPPGKPTAKLEVARAGTAWICANTPSQILQKDKNGRASIPAGERVTIGMNFATSDGYMNYTCTHSVSLVPVAGAEYLQDFESEGSRCSALVYLKTDDKRVGLDMEPTLGYGGAGCTQ